MTQAIIVVTVPIHCIRCVKETPHVPRIINYGTGTVTVTRTTYECTICGLVNKEDVEEQPSPTIL